MSTMEGGNLETTEDAAMVAIEENGKAPQNGDASIKNEGLAGNAANAFSEKEPDADAGGAHEDKPSKAAAAPLKSPPRNATHTNGIVDKIAEPECSISIRGVIVTPKTEAERKELHDWTEEIFGKAMSPTIKPSSRLVSILGEVACDKDLNWRLIICSVLNASLASVAAQSGVNIKAQGNSELYSISSDPNAPLELSVPKDSHYMPVAVLYLYYFALECILLSHKSSNRSMLILNPQFHKSLFALCHFCLRKATDHGQPMFNIQGTGGCPIIYYKLVESFVQELNATSNTVMSLPAFLTRVLRQIQEMILDSIWLSNLNDDDNANFGPSFICMVNKLRERPSSWPLPFLRQICPIKAGGNLPPKDGTNSKECMFVGYIMQRLLVVIEHRLRTICSVLSLRDFDAVKEQTMVVFTSLMCYRVDIFFNRHPDQILLCAVYAVCTKMKLAPEMTFRKIIGAYEKKTEAYLSRDVVHDILYRIDDCSEDGEIGNIVSLYNNVFVPSMIGLWGAFTNPDNPPETTSTLPW